MFFTKNIFSVHLAVVLCLLSLAKFAVAAPKTSNGLTFNYVGQGGNLDPNYNHMLYVPIEIKASTDYKKQIIRIESGNFSDYVSLCTDDHCGYSPIGEPSSISGCNINGTTTLGPNESCYLWLKANNYDNQFVFQKTQQHVQLMITSDECDNDSCSTVTYQPLITMDVSNYLYAGGEKGLYSYDTTGWQKVATVDNTISSITSYNGELYVGGYFTYFIDSIGNIGHAYLSALTRGNLLKEVGLPNLDGPVNALANYAPGYTPTLEIGGEFTVHYAELKAGTYSSNDITGYPVLTISMPLNFHNGFNYLGSYSKGDWGSKNMFTWNAYESSWQWVPEEYSSGSGYIISNIRAIARISSSSPSSEFICAAGILPNNFPVPSYICGTVDQSSGDTKWQWASMWGGSFQGFENSKGDNCYYSNPACQINALNYNPDMGKLIIAGDMDSLLSTYYIRYHICNIASATWVDGYVPHPLAYGVNGQIYSLLNVGNYVIVAGGFDHISRVSDSGCLDDVAANRITYFTMQNGTDVWNNGTLNIPPLSNYNEPAIHSLIMVMSLNNLQLKTSER